MADPVVAAAVVAPNPITIAAAAVSIISGLKNIFGGGGKEPSLFQGYRFRGNLTSKGLQGNWNAFDNLGNEWSSGDWLVGEGARNVFARYFGTADTVVPVTLDIPGTGSDRGDSSIQDTEAWQKLDASFRLAGLSPLPPAPPAASLFAGTSGPVPVSLFDLDAEADRPAAPGIIRAPTPAATGSSLPSQADVPAPVSFATPGSNAMTPSSIIPSSMQSAALRSPSAPAATQAPAPSPLPVLLLAGAALLAVTVL